MKVYKFVVYVEDGSVCAEEFCAFDIHHAHLIMDNRWPNANYYCISEKD